MNYDYFSNRNPFFRKNLFEYLVGRKLIDIRRTFHNTNKENLSDSDILNRGDLITIELDNQFKLTIGASFINLIEIKEIQYEDNKCAILDYKSGRFSGFSFYFKIRSFNKSLEKYSKELKELMGQRIVDYFLINETDSFRQKIRIRMLNFLKIRGVGFTLSNRKRLYIVSHFGILKIGTSLNSIFENFNYNLKEEEDYKITKDFHELGRAFEDIEGKKFILDKKTNIDSWQIDRNQSLSKIIAPCFVKTKLSFDSDDIFKFINSYPEINIKNQLSFLEELKNDMIKNKYGLADLKFGFDQKLNLKLIIPLDIIFFNEVNQIAIDWLIDFFKSQLLQLAGSEEEE